MAKTHLTERSIKTLPVPISGSSIRYFDDHLRGFGVEVHKSGRKSFFIYYGPKKDRKQMKIGDFGTLSLDRAREKAKELLAQIQLGADPQQKRETERQIPSFSEWAATYLEIVATRRKPGSLRNDRRYLDLFAKVHGRTRLDLITSEMIATFFRRMTKATPIQANRWLAAVRSCLEEAVRLRKVSENVAALVKPNSENAPRQRVLSQNEIERLLSALREEKDPYAAAAIRILLATGCRISEVLNLKWTDVDFDGGLLLLRSPKAGTPQTQPLSDEVVSILRDLPRKGEFVVAGKKPGRPRYDLKGPWKRLRERTGISDATRHDIRRTFGSRVTEHEGIHVACKMLRHSDLRTTAKVYAPVEMAKLRRVANSYDLGQLPATSDNPPIGNPTGSRP